MKPGYIRRGWAVAGLTLIALAAPLIFILGAMATAVSLAGALALNYALFPSGYPLLAAVGSFSLAGGVLLLMSIVLN